MYETVHAKAIRKAAETLGSVQELQRFLQVPSHDLLRWMNGAEEPPLQVFLRVVDIILEKPAG